MNLISSSAPAELLVVPPENLIRPGNSGRGGLVTASAEVWVTVGTGKQADERLERA